MRQVQPNADKDSLDANSWNGDGFERAYRGVSHLNEKPFWQTRVVTCAVPVVMILWSASMQRSP